jgi:hypothetical protein
MKNKNNILELYTGIIGIAALAAGILNIIVWSGIYQTIDLGLFTIGGDDFFRWVWGSLVVIFGGIMLISGAKDIHRIEQFSKSFLGAVMIWIVAGTDIFATLCENIPAGEESAEFFNSLSGFISAFAPPYAPAVILLPSTLVFAVYYFRPEEN